MLHAQCRALLVQQRLNLEDFKPFSAVRDGVRMRQRYLGPGGQRAPAQIAKLARDAFALTVAVRFSEGWLSDARLRVLENRRAA